MHNRLMAACLALVAVVILATAVGAAPSLNINKPPVVPSVSWTGPQVDPQAIYGQWFRDRLTGLEEWRSHEFHDNAFGSGGGGAGTSAITGIAQNIVYLSGPGTNILRFDVEAIITNDTPGFSQYLGGYNSHGESRQPEGSYEGPLLDVKLTASFAIDMSVALPLQWVPPYTDRTPYIVAENHDQLAWYCWTPGNPIEKMPYGDYYVPTWDFGDIAQGGAASRTLKFSIPGTGLPPTDSRYVAIVQSADQGQDLFLNRSISLKVSDWIDELVLDTGVPYPEVPYTGSDVSVFHVMEEVPDNIDWGDAPERPYPTLAASNGANHVIVQGFCLGNLIDGEPDGQPDPNAQGDDLSNSADEDGVVWLGPLVPGQPSQVQVFLTSTGGSVGMLDAWIDFNGDGSWATLSDQIAASWPLMPSWNIIPFTVPASATPMIQTFARFRLSTAGGLAPTGAALDGEVEDYPVYIEKMPEPDADWGDAPDSPYPTLAVNNGASHTIVTGFCLGTNIDGETDGQPDPNAAGDDNNGVPDDEDGVNIGVLVPGANAAITVTATIPAGTPAFLDGWIDWNGDGSWATAGDQIFAAQPVLNGTNTFSIPVPSTTGVGLKSFARFRLSTSPNGLPFTGSYPDGEVEDYPVSIGYKWTQRPDLTPTGIDVKATYPNVLADDFLCTVSGPVTDIHVWGSWKNDEIEDPSLVEFTLSFHEDIPAGTDGIPYSQPGRVLWVQTFRPGQFVVSHEAQVTDGEGWWDPADLASYVFPGDFNVWRYDFYVQDDPFYQSGSEDMPVVYWLDVQARSLMGDWAEFGWKTCLPEDRWNDDATFGLGQEPFAGPWQEMRYPMPHPFAPQSLDLAFALTGRAEPRDWGDAPDPTYPTLSASGGASHAVQPGFCLGNLIDSEGDGQPNPTATGDDIVNVPDEDGVMWAPLIPGQMTTILINVSTPGLPAFLDAWIDFNGNGSWSDLTDQIAVAMPVVAGPNAITFNVPRTWIPMPIMTFARFRLSTNPNGLPYTGPWSDGEVEDYSVRIDPDRGTLNFGKYKDIADHYWWRTHPDPTNEMLSLNIGADLVEPVSWDSVTLSLSGGAPGDVAQIDVWLDNNGDAQVDSGDTNIGTAINPVSPVTIPLSSTVIPAGGNVLALITYQMSPAASIGTGYSFQVTSATGTGQMSGLPAYITGLPVSSCVKTVVPAPISIGQAKLLPTGSTVFLKGKICTAAFAPWNLFYIEETNRSAGIGVQFTGLISPATKDDNVTVFGTTALLNGTELTIQPISVQVMPGILPGISPVGMNNKWAGGGTFGGQPAVYDQAMPLPGITATGLSNVGMLIRTWGLVTYHDSAFTTPTVTGPMFWIDDGSNLMDGFMLPLGGWTRGVACYYGFCGHPSSFPDMGEYWGVTGIMRSIPNANMIPQAVRLLVPRAFPDDLNEYVMSP